MALAAARGFGSVFALRFLLGLTESALAPAWLILTSMFYTRDEQPLRMCVYIGSNGLANIIAAGICVGLGSVNSAAVEPWQLIFLVSMLHEKQERTVKKPNRR
jgi:MFS family permease